MVEHKGEQKASVQYPHLSRLATTFVALVNCTGLTTMVGVHQDSNEHKVSGCVFDWVSRNSDSLGGHIPFEPELPRVQAKSNEAKNKNHLAISSPPF
jgi:hypothetical protein